MTDAFVDSRVVPGLPSDVGAVADRITSVNVDGLVLLAYEYWATGYNGPVVEILVYEIAEDATRSVMIEGSVGDARPLVLGRTFADAAFEDLPVLHSSWKSNGLADCITVLEYRFDPETRTAIEIAQLIEPGLVDGPRCPKSPSRRSVVRQL